MGKIFLITLHLANPDDECLREGFEKLATRLWSEAFMMGER